MASDEIYRQLTRVFQDVFDDDDISLHPAMSAADVDDWDSLNHIRLIVAVEKRFGVKFTTSEVGDLENVGQFADLVEMKLARGR